MTSGTPRVSGTEGSRLIGTVRRSQSITKKQSALVACSHAVRTAFSMSGSPQSVPAGRSGNAQSGVVQRGTPSAEASINAPSSPNPYRSPQRLQRAVRMLPWTSTTAVLPAIVWMWSTACVISAETNPAACRCANARCPGSGTRVAISSAAGCANFQNAAGSVRSTSRLARRAHSPRACVRSASSGPPR